MKNLQIRLASRPSGEPKLDNFELRESDILIPRPGQMLLRAICLSLDPYMRGRMNAGKSYARPVDGCPIYTEYFKDGDEIPRQLCTLHKGTIRQRITRTVQGWMSELGRRVKGIFR